MTPTFFVEMKEFPVTPVGKVDRKKLPKPTIKTKKNIKLPNNDVEKQLVQLWEKLLNVQPIGVTESYFDLGGNSLLAMRMIADIEKKFNKRLPASIIFQEETIEKLAKQITLSKTEISQSRVPIQPIGTKPPLFCIHVGGGDVIVYGSLASELGNQQPLYGLRFTNKIGDQSLTLDKLTEKYLKEIREVQPVGPYYLFGYCIGGVIAYEMAQKLLKSGQEVALLGILSYSNPMHKRVEIKGEIIYKNVILSNLINLFRMPLKNA